MTMSIVAPWNAMWSAEDRYEVRPCRYAGGQLAMWQPTMPGVGRPMFAEPHCVRQRRSIWEMRCTVCGEHTAGDDRWWFALGSVQGEYYMTPEAPVHRRCADLALTLCPHLKRNGCDRDLTRMPGGFVIVNTIMNGESVERDFGVKIGGRRVVGHLKLAWSSRDIQVIRRIV